jgi:hypothetical protein
MSVHQESTISTDSFAQVTFKMEAADCSWNLVFKSADETEELTFQINVAAAAAPTQFVFDPQNTNLSYSVGEKIEVMLDTTNWIVSGESFHQKMEGGEWTLVADPNSLGEADCAKYLATNMETFSMTFEVMRECSFKISATSVSDSTVVDWILNF